jgi:hypothetical protein
MPNQSNDHGGDKNAGNCNALQPGDVVRVGMSGIPWVVLNGPAHPLLLRRATQFERFVWFFTGVPFG